MLTAYLQLAAAMALVGSSVVVGKLIVGSFPVMVASGLTSLLAVAFLLPMLLRREGRLPSLRPRDLQIIVFQAFTGSFLWRILLFHGLALTTAVESGIITSTIPAAIGVISLVLGERLGRAKLAGIALAVLGILAINVAAGPAAASERGPDPLLGNLLIFGSVLGEASFTICGKAVSGRVSPLAISTLVSLCSLLMFVPFAVYEANGFDVAAVPPIGWASILYFGIGLNVLAFNLWFNGLARVPASTAAVFTGVLPISAVGLSYAVLREPFLPSHLVGLACVLAAIALIVRADARPARAVA